MPRRRGQASTSSKSVDTPSTPPQHFPPLHETPIIKKVCGATPYTSMHYKRDTRMNDLGSEMEGKFAGPICPNEFLQVFLPFEPGGLQQPRRMTRPFIHVAEQTVETAMYGPMIIALKRYCPGFELVDTHSHRDMSFSTNEPEIKPDVSLYISGCRRDRTIITDISLIDVHMEFKMDPNDNPFRDPESPPDNNSHDNNNDPVHSSLPFENNTLVSADTMGQITCYATQQLVHQFRTHAFSVLICKDIARLIYWDHSVIVR